MTAIHSAPIELAELAVKMRPDWRRVDLEGALAAAHTAGWKWTQTLLAVTRLLCQEDGTPAGLREQLRNPVERPHGAITPAAAREHAAHALQLIEARLGNTSGDTR